MIVFFFFFFCFICVCVCLVFFWVLFCPGLAGQPMCLELAPAGCATYVSRIGRGEDCFPGVTVPGGWSLRTNQGSPSRAGDGLRAQPTTQGVPDCSRSCRISRREAFASGTGGSAGHVGSGIPRNAGIAPASFHYVQVLRFVRLTGERPAPYPGGLCPCANSVGLCPCA